MKHVRYIYENPLERLIDTAHLRRKLDYLRAEKDYFRRDKYLRRHFSEAIKTLTKRLKAAVKSNYYIRTKWEMLLDPVRRMQVLLELGGEAALQRWEARRTRILAKRRHRQMRVRTQPRQPKRNTPAMFRHHPKTPAKLRIRTDRSGIFYLAPAVESPIRDGYRAKPYDPSCANRRPARPPRIALRPEELRGDVLMGLGLRPDGIPFRVNPERDPVSQQTDEVVSRAIGATDLCDHYDRQKHTLMPEPDMDRLSLKDGTYVEGPD